ncbi:CFEM domain protein [Ceratobasidium sp. AG-Ba]|nr:CFEM domain protein [Ceratobasidium sp. AG-Ba]
MKFSIIFVAAFAGMAAAQSACVVDCSTQAATSAGCSGMLSTDTECICSNQDFQTAAAECLQSNCTAEEQQQAVQLQQQLCGASSGTATASEPVETDTVSETDSATETDTATDSVEPSATATSPVPSITASTTPRTSAAATSRATSAASVISSASTRAASATTSPNAAVGLASFNFAGASVWTAVALGGVAIAQLLL